MPKSIAIKLDKPQLFGLLTLLGMAAAFIKLALAITAFTPQNQPTGYVAQDELSNYDLTSGTETVYRPEYEKDTWSGNLYAYPVDTSGNVNTAAERWTGTTGTGAKGHIDAQNYSTGRFIATMKDDGTAIPFLSANMSATQQASLAATIQSTAYTSTQIVSFLRGDRSNESVSALRVRTSVLGDIVHSRPYYVADDTNPTVFVGANDGMLHAINTADGTERWAYVPSMLLSKMKALAANPYTHDYYVDGQINIADVVISGDTEKVLVGGLGGGGKGLYALNINDLTAASDANVASKVRWEITPTTVNYATPQVYPSTSTATAYANLGYTYGTPTIGKVESTQGTDEYAVIVGNGYNDSASGDYQAYLYVINMADGQLIKSIKAGTSGTAASPNGLSTPAAVDVDSNGKIDRVYAGDLNGTMWKFDLSSTTSASWTATALYTTSPAQPITTTPGVAVHPNGGYMVNFGTGQMFSYTFPSSTRTLTTDPAPSGTDADKDTVYYVYGIWDGAPVANTTLVTQTLTERSYTYASVTTRVRRSSATAPSWSSGGNKGWKVALPAGERVIGEGSFIESSRFYFNSYNPNVGYAVPNTTTNEYGENWLNELNYLTGGSSTLPFLDLDGNLLLNNSDRIVYTATDTVPAGKAVGDPITSPNEDGIPVSKWISRGVQSQPVLVTLATLNTTLFNQNPDVTFPATVTGERGVAGGHFDVDIFYGTNMGCSSVAGVGTKAVGYVDFTYSNNKDLSSFSITVGGIEILTSNNPPSLSRSNLETWVKNNSSSTNYTISTSNNKIKILAKNVGTAYNATIIVSATGLSSGDRTITNVAGGADASLTGPYSNSSTSCAKDTHVHQYDDEYDRTGVNFLNASNTSFNLSNAIASTSTNFKVLMMNQYLNPAVSIHIGDASYNSALSTGYVSVKDYQASSGLDITTVPTYNRDSASDGDGFAAPKYIGSLAINMPVDAFVVKDWWGGSPADSRVGLMPTTPTCAYRDSGVGADMYNPVIPPANGTDGPGTAGTTTGVRHNGALTLEIIKDTTPASAIEENVSGRPEYGYRVKQADYYTYVLAEYIVYWHHPNAMCYHTTNATHWTQTNNEGDAWNTTALMDGDGWTKAPPQDTATSTAESTPASGSTDPKLGTLGATGTVASTTVSIVSNVTTTTTTYTDGTKTIVVRTTNSDGTVTIVTTNYAADNTVTSTSTSIVADSSGSVKTGGDERGLQARTGRISWHELVRD